MQSSTRISQLRPRLNAKIDDKVKGVLRSMGDVTALVGSVFACLEGNDYLMIVRPVCGNSKACYLPMKHHQYGDADSTCHGRMPPQVQVYSKADQVNNFIELWDDIRNYSGLLQR